MASLYRPTVIRYIDPQGRQVLKGAPGAKPIREKSKTFRGRYRDADGKPRTVSLCDDEETAESMLADIVKRVRREWAGDADPFEASRLMPLSDHINDFERQLIAKNRSEQHVYKVPSYLRRTADACGWKYLKDLQSDDLDNYLHDQRQPCVVTQVSLIDMARIIRDATDLTSLPLARVRRLKTRLPTPEVAARRGIAARWYWSQVRPILAKEFSCELPETCPLPFEPGMSFSTSNDYVAACKNFGNWLTKCRPKRWPENPFSSVAKLNADEDPRHERRPASWDDLCRIVAAARTGKPFRELSGVDRAVLYVTAAYTGLRANELASLHTASLWLDDDPPMILVQAAYSKRRRKDRQPIRSDLAVLLRDWLSERRANEPTQPTLSLKARRQRKDATNSKLWPGSWFEDAAEMLRVDLAVAGIDYEDSSGRVLDFHALRGSFSTLLAKAGVAPKSAQELMRHSDIRLTMQKYTTYEIRDLVSDLDRLPPIPWSEAAQSAAIRANGTDLSCTKSCNAPTEISRFQPCSTISPSADRHLVRPTKNAHFQAENERFHRETQLAFQEPSVGFEPTTYALRKCWSRIIAA